MKTFYTDDFAGVWPVGTAAVVVAPNRPIARRRLAAAIREKGLAPVSVKNPCRAFEMHEVKSGCAVVICDGEY